MKEATFDDMENTLCGCILNAEQWCGIENDYDDDNDIGNDYENDYEHHQT